MHKKPQPFVLAFLALNSISSIRIHRSRLLRPHGFRYPSPLSWQIRNFVSRFPWYCAHHPVIRIEETGRENNSQGTRYACLLQLDIQYHTPGLFPCYYASKSQATRKISCDQEGRARAQTPRGQNTDAGDRDRYPHGLCQLSHSGFAQFISD
jgi:hypothetical protein